MRRCVLQMRLRVNIINQMSSSNLKIENSPDAKLCSLSSNPIQAEPTEVAEDFAEAEAAEGAADAFHFGRCSVDMLARRVLVELVLCKRY